MNISSTFYSIRDLASGAHLAYDKEALTQNIDEMWTPTSKEECQDFLNKRADSWRYTLVTWKMEWDDQRTR